MKRVFLSHVEEDQVIALEMARELDAIGYSAWCYENDAVPGPSYLVNTRRAIDECAFFLLLISLNSMSSNQITKELERAHEQEKPIIPVLFDVSDKDYKRKKPIWAQIIGTNTSITLSPANVREVVKRIGLGLRDFDVPADLKAFESAQLVKASSGDCQKEVAELVKDQIPQEKEAVFTDNAAWIRLELNKKRFAYGFSMLTVLSTVAAIFAISDEDDIGYPFLILSIWALLNAVMFWVLVIGDKRNNRLSGKTGTSLSSLLMITPSRHVSEKNWKRAFQISLELGSVSLAVLLGLPFIASDDLWSDWEITHATVFTAGAGVICAGLASFCRQLALQDPANVGAFLRKYRWKSYCLGGFGMALGLWLFLYRSLDGQIHWGLPFSQDSIERSYERPAPQVFDSARAILKRDGTLLVENSIEYVLKAEVLQRDVWVITHEITTNTCYLVVQARTSHGSGDIDLVRGINKQIASSLAGDSVTNEPAPSPSN
jgi:hypothetical protein